MGPPVQRRDFLLSRCTGRRVLHLGCTNWPYTGQAIEDNSLLHSSIVRVADEVYGIDLDQEGLDILKNVGDSNLYNADLEDLSKVSIDDTFEVVIAGEIIEHLNNPGLFLEGIKRFMTPESSLIITTVNAYCFFRTLLYAFRGKRGTVEPIHPDHVSYYSFSTLTLLLNRLGFSVDEFEFYDIGLEHRPYNRRILNYANDLAVWAFPQLSDGIVAICSLAKEMENSANGETSSGVIISGAEN